MIRGLTLPADALRALASAGSAAAALPTLAAGQLSIRKLLLLDAVAEQRAAEGGGAGVAGVSGVAAGMGVAAVTAIVEHRGGRSGGHGRESEERGREPGRAQNRAPDPDRDKALDVDHDRERDRARLAAATALLARAGAAPGAIDAVLGAPETGLWAARRVRAGGGGDREHGPWRGDPLALVCAIAAAAAIRAGLTFDLDVPLVDGLLVLPGIALLPTDWRHSVRITGQGGGWQAGVHGRAGPAGRDWIRPLTPSLSAAAAAVATATAISATAADPPGCDLVWAPRVHSGGRDVRADQVWRLRHGDDVLSPVAAARPADAERTLAAAWSLLAARHPGFAADVAGCVTDLIPLRASARSTSASNPSAFGAVWVDLGRAPLQVAMSLVHECQHSVLAALHDLLPLHDDDPRRAYPVPWHAEPRTVNALLHGLYAHTAQAEFWHAEAGRDTPDAEAHRDRLAGWCRTAVAVARNADGLTTEGELLVEGTSWRLAALASSIGAGASAHGRGPRPRDPMRQV